MAKSAFALVLAATTSTVQAGSCQCSCCNWCEMTECEDGYHCCGATGPDGPWVHPACEGEECLNNPWCATCDAPTPTPTPTPPPPTPPHVVTGRFTIGPYQDPLASPGKCNCGECTETYCEGCEQMIWHDEGGAPGDRIFLTQCQVGDRRQMFYPAKPIGTQQEGLADQFMKNEDAGDSKCMEGWHGEDKATMRPNCHASVDDVRWIIPEGVNVPITANSPSGQLCLECGSGYDNPCYSRPCDATVHKQLFTVVQHPSISVDRPMEV